MKSNAKDREGEKEKEPKSQRVAYKKGNVSVTDVQWSKRKTQVTRIYVLGICFMYRFCSRQSSNSVNETLQFVWCLDKDYVCQRNFIIQMNSLLLQTKECRFDHRFQRKSTKKKKDREEKIQRACHRTNKYFNNKVAKKKRKKIRKWKSRKENGMRAHCCGACV